MKYDFECIPEPSGSGRKRQRLEITIPVRLPTWNFLFAANRWKREKVRNLIHELVLRSSIIALRSQTPTECQPRPQSMDLLIAEYYAAIQPKKYKSRSVVGKSKSKMRLKKRR